MNDFTRDFIRETSVPLAGGGDTHFHPWENDGVHEVARELAWTHSADGLLNWHRHLSYVRQEVDRLTTAGIFAGGEFSSRLMAKVYVNKDLLDEFYDFAREADRITDDDMKYFSDFSEA